MVYNGNLGKPYSKTRQLWVKSLFVHLQYAVQRSITRYLGDEDNIVPSYKMNLREAPYHAYETSTTKISTFSWTWFTILAPAVYEVMRVLDEKKKKLHEHVCRSTGLSVQTLGLSNFLFAALKAAPIASIFAGLLFLQMKNVDPIIIILFFMCAGIALCSFPPSTGPTPPGEIRDPNQQWVRLI